MKFQFYGHGLCFSDLKHARKLKFDMLVPFVGCLYSGLEHCRKMEFSIQLHLTLYGEIKNIIILE